MKSLEICRLLEQWRNLVKILGEGGGGKVGANFPKPRENDSEKWKISHRVQGKDILKNLPISVDAWIMQA